jgi:nitroreductase
MSTASPRLTEELIRTASLAPSVANTQPWLWRRTADDVVELRADRTRQLTTLDPHGRELVISCGSALHHFLVAADAFGLVASPAELPVPEEPDLLAVVRLGPGTVTDEGAERLAALENRRTDRRGVSDWPVPPQRLLRMAEVAEDEGARVVVLDDPGVARRAEELLEAARKTQLVDAVAMAEQEAWRDRESGDGVPGRVAEPTQHLEPHHPPTRFTRHASARDPRDEHQDVLIAIATVDDDAAAWLAAGRTLSALWLEATRTGLALTPTTQVTEVASTRLLLGHDVLQGLHPQVLARIGWPAAAAASPRTERTPRRRVADVLDD